MAKALDDAGYETLICEGTERCPIVAGGDCALVDGADVVLDSLDYDALRALCDRLDVKPHALARETGMRKALVKSQAA